MFAVVTITSLLCVEEVNHVPVIARIVGQLNMLSIIHEILVVADNPDMDLSCLENYRITIVTRNSVVDYMQKHDDNSVLVCPCDLPFLSAPVLRSFLQHSQPFGKMVTLHGDTAVLVMPCSLYATGGWHDHPGVITYVVDDIIGIAIHGSDQKLQEIQQIFDQPFVSFHDQSMIKKSHIVDFLSHKMNTDVARELFGHVHSHFPMKTFIFQWHPWTGIVVLAVFSFEFRPSYKIGFVDCIIEHPFLRQEGLRYDMSQHLIWLGRHAGCRKVRFR